MFFNFFCHFCYQILLLCSITVCSISAQRQNIGLAFNGLGLLCAAPVGEGENSGRVGAFPRKNGSFVP